MRPLDEANLEEQYLPIDGLEVEEFRDEDTLRQFVQAWRQRVSREYAMSILGDTSRRSAARSSSR